MFDLKLTDIFSTICIGVLTAVLITYFYFIWNKFFVKDRFDNDAFSKWIKELLVRNYKESGYTILALVIIFCLGTIAGDLTERMTDSDDINKSLILKELSRVSFMDNVEKTRMATLVDLEKDRPTHLGASVFRTPTVVKNANHYSGSSFFLTTDSISTQWRNLSPQLKNKDSMNRFNGFVQEIYYTAKNWCFSMAGEPLNELKSIQNRIDLSRSMVLLLACSTQFLLLLVIANLIYVLIIRQRDKRRQKQITSLKNWDSFIHLTQGNILLLMLIIIVISRECYGINQTNYNKRVYGYYISAEQRSKPDSLALTIKPEIIKKSDTTAKK
jgi:hypothetical protein